MKNVQVIILFSYLILAKFSLAEKENNSAKPLIKPPYREYVASSFYAKFYQGFGFRNVAWDLDFNYQYRNYFSVGLGNGFHGNKYPIFSSSDKHVLKMWSYPLYVTGNIFLFANEEKAFYFYGKYGRSFAIRTKDVNPNDDFKPVIAEGGIGYQYFNGNRNVYLEIGQYYTTANGEFNSTYNSTINYDLQIYTIVARIGFRFDF